MSYIDSYYARTQVTAPPSPPLVGAIECDTCVIGAGLAGLTIALALSRAGQSVIVLDAENVGWGASGRNGGFCAPGYATAHAAIVAQAGAATARELHLLSIEGMELVRANIAALEIGGVGMRPGILSVRRYPDADHLRAEVGRLKTEYDYDTAYLGRDEVRQVLRSSRYFDAIRDPGAFQMHTLNYALGLAAEIERLGGRIHAQSAAVDLALDIPTKVVGTAKGSVAARDLVIATGGYTGHLVPALKRAMLAIATYVLVTKPAPELLAGAIATADAVLDNRRAGDYYRLVDDGQRLLWGGRISTSQAKPSRIAAQLRRQMLATYPQLAGVGVDVAWSGLMSYARHQMPQIGRLRPNVYYCTAFGGHGLNTTAAGGKVIAEAILGQSDRYRLFAPFGLANTWGSAGLAAAQLTYWKLQLGDWWRERQAMAG